MEIFDKSINKKCKRCKGKGELPYKNSFGEVLHFIEEKDKCNICNGTGIYKDEYYVIEGNGIAFDTEYEGK